MASLAGKVFCVTGAASGIGLSTVKTLLSRGASVGMSDVNEKVLQSAYDTLPPTEQSRVFTMTVDVAERSHLKRFFEDTKKHFGELHGVANIAGVVGPSFGILETWQLETKEYEFVMDVNVRGVFNSLAESMVPGLLASPSSIVNIGSVASARGYKKGILYSASKHAVVGLTKSAAIEGGSKDIRVNIVLPGPTDTPLLRIADENYGSLKRASAGRPIQRTAHVDELSSVIVFLLSPESSYMTGSVVSVDGGSLA
ncbi:oxidoreductase [Talaromyces proteolyticus]|uniref:Oxidoreductase n=1 Tax=Talaromyces proteolyticus TaxID=1131652 RepID=A0AAD4PW72_9EURO|nr:oxidoreductase [Talaromyces proteolyticus]KAH8697530.1 oxidoreductase [Talaromyces proteolyticus]